MKVIELLSSGQVFVAHAHSLGPLRLRTLNALGTRRAMRQIPSGIKRHWIDFFLNNMVVIMNFFPVLPGLRESFFTTSLYIYIIPIINL